MIYIANVSGKTFLETWLSIVLLYFSFFLNFLDISMWRADSHATHMNFDEISVLVQTSLFLTSSLNATDEPLSHRATKLYALLVLISLNASDEPPSRLRGMPSKLALYSVVAD